VTKAKDHFGIVSNCDAQFIRLRRIKSKPSEIQLCTKDPILNNDIILNLNPVKRNVKLL
jgi:hypothetical protein